MSRCPKRAWRVVSAVGLIFSASLALAAEPLVPAGVLSSYAGLAPAHTLQTQALWRGNPVVLTAAKTARISGMFGIAPEATDHDAPK